MLPSVICRPPYGCPWFPDIHRGFRNGLAKVGARAQVAATKQERSLPLNDPSYGNGSSTKSNAYNARDGRNQMFGGGGICARVRDQGRVESRLPLKIHKSIDTMVRGLFNVFFLLYIRITLLPFYSVKWVFRISQSLQNGGAGASRPAFNKYFFIKGLGVFLYYTLDNALSTPKAR